VKQLLLALATVAVPVICADSAAAQVYEGYLDVLTCKVKPEKRADFDALAKKMADANRRYKGDTFVTGQVEYGEQNTVIFTSGRENYAAIDKGIAAFEGALKEAYGPGAIRIEQDFNACVISSQAEIRKRRGDLSINLPGDMAAVLKVVGSSRWVRTAAFHVRTGHVDDFEAQIKTVKQGLERSNPSGPIILVSQAVVGNRGAVFYLTTFRTSLADFDRVSPSLKEVLGMEGFKEYQKSNSENVQLIESTLSRYLPELSNPPKEVAEASSDFWNPKPAVMKKPAAKPSAGTKTGD